MSQPAHVGHPDLQASLQHLTLLAGRRERLEFAQLDTEDQILQSVGRLFRAGILAAHDLLPIYQELRAITPPEASRHSRPSLHVRWVDSVGLNSSEMRSAVKNAPNGPQGWEGDAPLGPFEICPPRGVSVVYVLFDETSEPCYVGSTKTFRDRLKVHLRDGKPAVRWVAYPCASRAHAYLLEDRLLRQHMPYMNRKASR